VLRSPLLPTSHLDFDLDTTLYFFTAGRYEYRNKGIDMFIESLACGWSGLARFVRSLGIVLTRVGDVWHCAHRSHTALNEQLKFLRSNVTIVAFFITPAPARSFTVEALKGQAVTKQLRDTVNEITQQIGQRIFDETVRYAAAAWRKAIRAARSLTAVRPMSVGAMKSRRSGKIPDTKDLLSQEDMVLLKRRIFALKRDTLPPIVTHNMVDDANDPILKHLRRANLFNRPQDRVKVVFHPEFLNSNNPLFGLDYEDFVRGCHLGVFPSYYEPWYARPARAVDGSISEACSRARC